MRLDRKQIEAVQIRIALCRDFLETRGLADRLELRLWRIIALQNRLDLRKQGIEMQKPKHEKENRQ